MIPKVIHYCWFGGNPLPKLAKKCIKSWKKYCPDYEIIRWDESNFDVSAAPLYVRQAYEAKKWAFVTDYVRLYAMTTYGGIYMDTDVEVIKPLDGFLRHQAFSGFQSPKEIPTGIMASEKDFPLFEEFLKYYDTASFYNEDGSLNMITNVVIMTDICLQRGLLQNGQYQKIDGFELYPSEYFCAKNFYTGIQKITPNTYSIHHFDSSWFNKDQKANKRKRWREKFVEAIIYNIRYAPNRILIMVLGADRYERLKQRLKKNNV